MNKNRMEANKTETTNKEGQPINFHNKTFVLLQNSEEGTVNSNTIFEYKQDGNLVTADYHGGTIRYGKVIARLLKDELHMHYQCFTIDEELKAGQAIAKITFTENEKIRLDLDWKWIGESEGTGKSVYVEI